MKTKDYFTQVIKAPVVSEKSHRIAEKNKTFVFKVSPTANKYQIINAIEKLFDVKVARVNTVSNLGKKKNFSGRSGVRAGFKKAYITLKDGHDINFAQA